MDVPAGARVGIAPVLVTGASGGVGSAIVRMLMADPRWPVVALDRAAPPPVPGPDRVRSIQADLRSADLQRLVHDRVAAVVHCAARIPGPGSDEPACAADNRCIDDNLLAFCATRRVPVVFFSTASVYPRRSDGAWVDEGSAVEPSGPYAAAKLASEAQFLALPSPGAAIFRITSPYGPGQLVDNVVWRFCRAAAAGQPIEVWGSGRREQDFIHVGDIGQAVARALAAPDFPAGVYLIAAGHPTTMADLAETALRVASAPVGPRIGGPADPDDGRTARYNIARARARLAWEPAVSLDEGIASCLLAWRNPT